LNPNKEYFWRVRAKDEKGLWGDWSDPFSFKCIAPGVPLNVRAVADIATGTVILTWDANPKGRPPVAFKVYGSDEKGFTASDTEYLVVMGRGFCTNMDEFKDKSNISNRNRVKTPTNLITVTKELHLSVVGPGLGTHPNINKAFYRVVAVNVKGNTSGPSDYAEFHRPFIYTCPSAKAIVGQPYKYEPAAIASIGDLKCKGGYNVAFWDREVLTFSLNSAPGWLEIDAATGKISGTPPRDTIGMHEFTLRVTNSNALYAEQKLAIDVTCE